MDLSFKKASEVSLSKQKYFDSLDALRFFAFLIVFLCHIPPFAKGHWYECVRPWGRSGVYFFFVLSGFLISYIIMKEKHDYGKINLKNFYIRRVLRIWPLYYVFITIGFIGIKVFEILHFNYEGTGYDPDWRYTVFFLENHKSWIEGTGPKQANFSLLWSLCLEEQFYLIWPIVLSILPLNKFPQIALLMIFLSFILKLVYHHYDIMLTDVFVVLDLFSAGALLAWIYLFRKEQLENLIRKVPNWVRVLYLVAIILFIIMQFRIFQYFEIPELYDKVILSWLFLITIALFLPEGSYFKFSKNNWLSTLGKITYGLYLFHSITIRLLHHAGKKVGLPSDGLYSFVLFIICALLISVAISYLSFRYFESYFLKLKKKFI